MAEITRADLKARIVRAFESLRKAMGWTQREFAEKLEVAPATFSNYINPDNEKLPDLRTLVNLCRIPEFRTKGLEFSIDTLLSPDFDPASLVKKRDGAIANAGSSGEHGDFLGAYLGYFFDQTKSFQEQEFRASRDLRYGVICCYDDFNGVTGDSIIRVYASFYKKEIDEIAKAEELKKTLDEIFADKEEPQSISSRNIKIRDAFSDVGNLYTGTVEFTEQHVFINLRSEVINDHALIILYSPHKRTDTQYIGGMGSVTSVAHGRSHMPTAQKIILTRYRLICSDEEIGEYLSMTNAPISPNNEAKALSEICAKLYGDGAQSAAFFDNDDKIAIISNRMKQLIRNYIEKNVCCVGSVSDEDDKRAYELIKKSAK